MHSKFAQIKFSKKLKLNPSNVTTLFKWHFIIIGDYIELKSSNTLKTKKYNYFLSKWKLFYGC